MNRSMQRISRREAAFEKGFALILTLLVLVLLTVLVVGFNAATRTEQMAARNFSYQGVASQMADVAVNRAIALLNSTVTNGVVTQPGRAWSPDSGFVQLSTVAIGAGATNVNMNRQQPDTNRTNFFIATNTNNAFFTVPLIDVRVSNVLVGRYGFWIDDDGSKVNLNAAWTNARTNFLATNARPYSLAVFSTLPSFGAGRFGAFGSLVTNDQTNSTQGWSWFFTPRQLVMMTNFDIGSYQNLMFQVSGGPGNQARGTFALAPAGQPGALDAGGTAGFLSSPAVGGNINYTRRYASLLQALDGVAARYLGGASYAKYFGNNGGLLSKYGQGTTRQIVANINDAVLSATADSFTGAGAADMLAGTNTAGSNNPVPRAVLGLRPTPYLNEVALGVAYSTNTTRRVEVQVWMRCEVVDPYRTGLGSGWQVKYKIKDLSFSGTYQAGATNLVNFTGGTNNWNSDGGLAANPNAASTNVVVLDGSVSTDGYFVPGQDFVFEWQLGTPNGITPGPLPTNASNVVINSITVRPALALLRTSTNPLSVRDWAVEQDFPSFTFTDVPQVAVGFDYEGTRAAAAPPEVVFSQGISKNDPRVRRFQTSVPPQEPWIQAAPSLGEANPTFNPTNGTGIAGVANDPASGATSIYNHPSFPTNATEADRIIPRWVTALDMGKIHTGLQWRTLQLRAQEQAERVAGHLPDWVLLEALTVSNNAVTVSAKMNVNSLSYPAAGTAGMTPQALLNAGMARPLAVASLLAGNTNPIHASSAQIDGVNLGIPTNAVFPGNSFSAVASNVTRLAFTPSWGGNRPTNLPTNALGMLAEVLEIDGVSNFTNNEAAMEGRVRGFYDALSASSDVFTIYSAGYALDKNTNVTGETFLRTQVARDPANPTKFRVVFTEPLIWD